MVPIIFIICMVLLDQAVKDWAVHVLQPVATIPLISNIFHFTYIENRGAAFSVLQNKIWLFVVLTVFILAAIVVSIRKNHIRTTFGKWSLYIIASGAIGNLLDRVVRGFVVDLFDFRLIHFPVFNVADILVCVGGVMFVGYIMLQHDKV